MLLILSKRDIDEGAGATSTLAAGGFEPLAGHFFESLFLILTIFSSITGTTSSDRFCTVAPCRAWRLLWRDFSCIRELPVPEKALTRSAEPIRVASATEAIVRELKSMASKIEVNCSCRYKISSIPNVFGRERAFQMSVVSPCRVVVVDAEGGWRLVCLSNSDANHLLCRGPCSAVQ
jgi:hypothetical protein